MLGDHAVDFRYVVARPDEEVRRVGAELFVLLGCHRDQRGAAVAAFAEKLNRRRRPEGVVDAADVLVDLAQECLGSLADDPDAMVTDLPAAVHRCWGRKGVALMHGCCNVERSARA